ncbi:MAG TPA: hypothetical protein DCZ41_01280 [Firmicutes bacterium]|nr:hypothetical protein [Bacillota bacterium]
MLVSLQNISFAYKKGKDVIHRCSFDFENGKFYAILGASGIGKTTLLRIIAGLEEDYSGNIFFDGREGRGIPIKERNLAYITQEYALYPRKTLFENIAYPLRLKEISVDEIKERVYAIAKPFDLLSALSRKPGQVSGGQKQKAALARALIKRPNLALFDEPLSNLDANSRVTIRPIIKELTNELGATSIYVTHNINEAMSLGDEILLFDKSGLRSLGKPLDVATSTDDKVLALFDGADSL